MTRTGQTRPAQLRALFAALFLLAGALSAPVALATQTADFCAMACCVSEGHCCCSPTHAYVEGQLPDSKPRISDSEVSNSCPESCTPAGRLSNLLFPNHHRAGSPQALEVQPPEFFIEQVVAVRDPVGSGPSAPRAPPISSTF